MKKILVATDFSPGAVAALHQGLVLADKFVAQLLLLHVIHDPAEAPGFYSSKKAGKKVFRNMEEAAVKMMEEFVGAHLKKKMKIKIETRVVPGLPAERIVHCASKEKADMIVMGTHGRNGLKRLMIGSVADKVIRSASCPVLVVKHTDGDEKKDGMQ